MTPLPFLVRAAAVAAVLGGTAAVVWSEAVTWKASFDAVPIDRLDPSPRRGDTVLVLGFRSSGHGRVNLIQRWRVRIALRSVDPQQARFVFSGGGSAHGTSEAAVMARYAIGLGVPRANISLEERSRTTWENISFSLPLIEDAEAIVVASNTFHARRARRYLGKQAPDVAARVRRGRDYRVGELLLVKPYLAIYEWRRSRLGLDA